MSKSNSPIGIGSNQVNDRSEEWARLRPGRDPITNKPMRLDPPKATPVGSDSTSKSNADGST